MMRRSASTLIDFWKGQPEELIMSQAAAVVARGASSLFQNLAQSPREADLVLNYSEEAGLTKMRAGLAGYLSSHYLAARQEESDVMDSSVDPQTIFITPGVSSSLEFACAHIGDRSRTTVLVEDPTYFLARNIFTDNGFSVQAVKTSLTDGLDVEALREGLVSGAIVPPRFVYVIPTYQNPTGATLSIQARKELVKLSKEFSFVVLADEVYQLLRYDDEAPRPPLPLAFFDYEPLSVISLGSFAKTFAPGMRVGWMQAGRRLVSEWAQTGFLLSGGGLSPVQEAIMTELLASGDVEEFRIRLVDDYAGRLNNLDRLLQQVIREYSLPLEYTKPSGGYFVWVRLTEKAPAAFDVTAFLTNLHKDCNVRILPGSKCASSGSCPTTSRAFRLCLARLGSAQVAEGLDILGAELRAALDAISAGTRE